MNTVAERTSTGTDEAAIAAALADAERRLADARGLAQRAQRDAAREYLRSGEVTSVTAEISALEDVVAGLLQLAIIAAYEKLGSEYKAARHELESASEAYRSHQNPDVIQRLRFAESAAEGAMQRASAYQLVPANAAVLADHRKEKSHE